MIRRRFGRPGLLGTIARTAVIAGTATAVSGGIQRFQQGREQSAAEQQELESDVASLQAERAAAAAPVASAPAAAPSVDDTVEQLTKLGSLKQAGLIDDAEFAAAKARLLGL